MTWLRSLRWRLTLLFVGVSAVTIALGAYGVQGLLEEAVWAPIDGALREEAEVLATLADSPAELDRIAHAMAAEVDIGPGRFVLVLARGGVLETAAGAWPPGALRIRVRSTGRTVRLPRDGERRPYRVVGMRRPGGGRVLVGVQAGAPLARLDRARVAISLGSLSAVVILGALAWAITGRTVREISRVAQEIEAIEAGALDRRMQRRSTLEVDRLVLVLNRLFDRLEAAVAHLRRFTGVAAHELRTPIAALRATLEVALGPDRSAAAHREALIDALEQTERLGRLADDLLTLSAVEAANLADASATLVGLDAVAREAAETVGPVAAEQQRTLETDASTPAPVHGVPSLLKRVVLNLLDNAFRHTPAGTPVRLRVWTEDGDACLEVRDAGPGMPPEDLAAAFERFRRGRGAGAGTGLGLALCREIVTRHHGTIALESAPGAGMRATVRLPRAPASEPERET